jgi:hypothetical protein
MQGTKDGLQRFPASFLAKFCLTFERHFGKYFTVPRKRNALSKFIFVERKRVAGLKANITLRCLCAAREFSCSKAAARRLNT